MNGEVRPGRHRAICDRSGFQCWDDELVTEWNGLRVLRRFSEPRHPQEFVRGRVDNQSVPNPRPEGTDVFLAEVVKDDNGVPIILADGSAWTTIGSGA